MDKRFFVILLAIVTIMGSVFWFYHKKAVGPGVNPQTNQASEHTHGAGNKGVTLIEYGDFQCPACKAYFPVVKELRTKYGEDITFQYRHFPLSQIHPKAVAGHRAAEAAGLQGKFFEMHDLLYERQSNWTTAEDATQVLESYAKEIGLNIDKFRQDFASEQVINAINADVNAGRAIGANSTPTFVINGKKVDQNPKDQASFEKLIDDAIKTRASSQGQNQ